ncbi:unnamed protein product [Amoebophrya sp. A120]|nr:unnamed protein product [Amoebophrya sp. A120]|eukprot:GSA120T00005953001.1
MRHADFEFDMRPQINKRKAIYKAAALLIPLHCGTMSIRHYLLHERPAFCFRFILVGERTLRMPCQVVLNSYTPTSRTWTALPKFVLCMTKQSAYLLRLVQQLPSLCYTKKGEVECRMNQCEWRGFCFVVISCLTVLYHRRVSAPRSPALPGGRQKLRVVYTPRSGAGRHRVGLEIRYAHWPLLHLRGFGAVSPVARTFRRPALAAQGPAFSRFRIHHRLACRYSRGCPVQWAWSSDYDHHASRSLPKCAAVFPRSLRPAGRGGRTGEQRPRRNRLRALLYHTTALLYYTTILD